MMLKNILCVAFVLCMPTFAVAVRTAWDGDTSTDFFDDNNWDSGAPQAGDGAKLTDSFIFPTFHPLLENGSAESAWFEVTHGVELTIGTNGVLTITGSSDSSSMAQATGSTGTIHLVDNGFLHTQSMYAAWEGDAFINMGDDSRWVADGDFQPFTLGHWDDSNRSGVATMSMSGNSRLTVASGDFRIRGNLPCCFVKSTLTLADNASLVIGGNQEAKIQGYINDGMLLNGEVTFDGANTIVTTIGGVFIPDNVFTWRSNSGDWNTASNWSPSGPPADPDHTVTFGNAIGDSAESVYTNSAVTVNSIAFDNTLGGSYAIGGTGSVNLESGSIAGLPPSGVSVSAGSHEFQLQVALQNDATVDLATSATLEFVNRLNINTNTLTKTGDGTLVISNTDNTGGGTLDCQAGTCGGSGRVGGNLNNPSGTVAPGNSPGILTVEGDYNQGVGGTLALEIGGTAVGVEHDQLDVHGDATMDGLVSVELINGFSPQGNDIFDVLDFINFSGSPTFDFSFAGGAAAWDTSQFSTDGTLRAIVVDGLDGDFDASNLVDIDDLNLVLFNWNVVGSDLPPEWTHQRPGDTEPVDITELNLVLFNWNAMGNATASVPEPGSAVLGLCALVCIFMIHRTGGN